MRYHLKFPEMLDMTEITLVPDLLTKLREEACCNTEQFGKGWEKLLHYTPKRPLPVHSVIMTCIDWSTSLAGPDFWNAVYCITRTAYDARTR